jgi:hypothetical protein
MKFCLANFFLSPLVAIAASTNALPALAPAYPEIPPTFWEQHRAAAVIGGFLFIIAQSFWLYKLLMRQQPVVEPPENLARAALDRLEDEPEDGNVLSEVSRILRRYFAATCQTPGEESTTAEFISALERNQKIRPVLGERLASFLRECDARKFSPANAGAPLNAAERALDLVNEAEALRAKQNLPTHDRRI